MRILQVMGSREITGAEIVVRDLTKALMRDGHDVSILCSPELATFYGSTKAVVMPAIYGGIGHLGAALLLGTIANSYEITHLHGLSAAIVNLLTPLCFRSKLVVTLHGGEAPFLTLSNGDAYELFLRCCLRISTSRACRVVAVSGDVARVFSWLGSKMQVVPNGIDSEDVELMASMYQHEARVMNDAKKSGAIRLFFPGILDTALKGQDVAIRAIAILVRRGVKLELFIAGSGKDRLRLEGLAEKLRVADYTHFLGYVDHPRMIGYMKCAEIVVTHLARRAPGGLSQIHLEAAVLCKPIVTAWKNDLAVFNGAMYFTKGSDPEDVAESIMRIAEDMNAARAVAARAAHIAEDYSWSNVSKTYARIYAQCVGT